MLVQIVTMQNRFRRLDIFSISVPLDRLYTTDIGGGDRGRDRFW